MSDGLQKLGEAVVRTTRPEPMGQRPTTAPMFRDRLERMRSEHASPEEQLREAAEMFVSTSMIMPMFQELRSNPLSANLFHGGQAESIFQQQLDQVLSDRIASATRFDMVDAVYNQLHHDVVGKAVKTHG